MKLSAVQKKLLTEQYVPFACECGHKGGAYMNHYDLVRCSCGKFFWALQPKRGGPLKSFPWPGQYDRQQPLAKGRADGTSK